MNRRSFLETLAKAAAGFTILPAATTYGRVWRAKRSVLDYRCEILPTINQYSQGVLEYVANSSGIIAQLRACASVVEQPDPLDLGAIKDSLYQIKRRRQEREFFNTIFYNRPIKS